MPQQGVSAQGHACSGSGSRQLLTGSPWTPPPALRAAAAGGPDCMHEAGVSAACDVWACTVALFFLRRGRWPFSQAQIRRWPGTPPEQWRDDEAIDWTVPGNAGGTGAAGEEAVAAGMDALEAAVFPCGRSSLRAFAGAMPTLQAIADSAWFQSGLPEGALAMSDTYARKTEAWRASAEFAAIQGKLEAMVAGGRAGPAAACGAVTGLEDQVTALHLGGGTPHSTQHIGEPPDPSAPP
eukprot:jgi/Ulvmu1/11936/UM082_0015.1